MTSSANKSVFKNEHHPAYFALLEKRFTYSTRDELIGKQINRGSPEKTLAWASQQHEYYHYDAVGQCISRLGDPQLGEVYYNYDEAGNHYDHSRWTVQSNQLQEFRGKQYKYDGFGRLRAIISGGRVEKQFEYDCQNQLIESLNNSSAIIKAKYEYDALGRRIKKVAHKSPKREYSLEGEENKIQLFFWQGLRMVGETTEAHLENRRWYAYNERSYEPIAFIDYWDIVKRDEVYYYHTNIDGAPEELTSESGEFTWQGLFSLFGKRYREKKDGHTLYGQPLRLQGQYFDEETGLHYNTFRHYDPDTGRFTQQDPIGLAGGLNLYQYSPNPIMWIDPLGWAKCGLTKEYDVVPYRPSNSPLENHHGLLDVWAAKNIPSYGKKYPVNSPTIALSAENHSTTKAVYRDLLRQKTGKPVGGKIDWSTVSNREMKALSEKMFDAANVPLASREAYYRALNQYLYNGSFNPVVF